MERFYAFSVEIFKNNFLYTDISLERFLALYSGARRLVDPDFVRFAVAPDGTAAGSWLTSSSGGDRSTRSRDSNRRRSSDESSGWIVRVSDHRRR
jgi:hypothetical protein